MTAVEQFANRAITVITAGGTDAPPAGTVETWTALSWTDFPAAETGVWQFHIVDSDDESEIMLVSNISGSSASVERGAEGTTPVAHSASGFPVYALVTAGWLNSISEGGGIELAGDLGGTDASPEVTSTHLTVSANGSASGNIDLDPTATRVYEITQSGNVTFNFTPAGSLASGVEYYFTLWLDPVTYTTAFSVSGLTWIGGTAPTLTPSAVNVLIFTTLNGGTTWYGAAVTEAPGLPLAVASGGTGTNSLAAGAVLLGGTADTSPLSAVSGVGSADQVLTSDGTSGPPYWANAPGATGLSLAASTGASGWTLTDSGSYPAGIISWTAPDDGDLHRVLVAGIMQVTSADTGGEISADWTLPNGDANSNWQLYVTSESTGIKQLLSWFFIEANTTFTVNQQAALTGGAAVAWIELWTS
jgi:hypothetical protein